MVNGDIDTTFKEVIPNKFDSCTSFRNSIAKVVFKSMGLFIDAYINITGKVIWQNESFKYEQ